MYLGSLNDYVPEKDRYSTKILLVTCKKAITRIWCKTEAPNKNQWLEIMRDVYTMERMTYQLRLKEGLFMSKWEKWLLYDTAKDA